MRRNQKAQTTSLTPKPAGVKKNRDIEKFFGKPAEEVEQSDDSNMADVEDTQGLNPSPACTTPDLTAIHALLADLPNKFDLAQLLTDIKSSIKQEVTVLQTELCKLTDRMTTLEASQQAAARKTSHLSTKVITDDTFTTGFGTRTSQEPSTAFMIQVTVGLPHHRTPFYEETHGTYLWTQ
ncbi:unnamed protein product [Protopolystoma xenopodis]|uniref:Uncharacterized protein n=1 Tax=Protopolystoma xenopodis TaxID=117903 RepID=A0A448XRK4_9PLAT|nr:unnamed protein product [Protopolystoma xenopodis]